MVPYRIIEEGVSFGNLSGEADSERSAVQMAQEFAAQKPGSKFVVEKVERIWPKQQMAEPKKDNVIHASIHLLMEGSNN
jgi:hypothetical protein